WPAHTSIAKHAFADSRGANYEGLSRPSEIIALINAFKIKALDSHLAGRLLDNTRHAFRQWCRYSDEDCPPSQHTAYRGHFCSRYFRAVVSCDGDDLGRGVAFIARCSERVCCAALAL